MVHDGQCYLPSRGLLTELLIDHKDNAESVMHMSLSRIVVWPEIVLQVMTELEHVQLY